jgi:hypothetical protein
MADDKAKAVLKRFERLKGDRGTTESHWQQCANYGDPNRADYITERTAGAKRMQYIFDQTPIWGLEQFVAGMHSLQTSSTIQWFYLRTKREALNRNQNVKLWLDAASAAMYAVFNSSRFNFASQAQQLYSDEGLIGTGCMSILEGRTKEVLFSTHHMKECVLAENEEERIDTNIRRFQYTASQAISMWGKAAGEQVVKAMASGNEDAKFWFLHSVTPRRQRDPQRPDNRNMAWESCYIAEADQAVIGESGFPEFPYVAPRLSKVTGEIYGRGRTMTALPDIKMLMELMKIVVKGAQKQIDPVIDMPDSGYLMPLRTTPGAIIFRRAGMRADERAAPLQTGGMPELGETMLKDLRNAILRSFYVDLLRMPTDLSDPNSDGKGSTATYWLQRREKEMMQLSPMFARSQAEFMGPLIDRVFNILWRKSVRLRFGDASPFPPPPAELNGAALDVEYVSPIAIAQKSSRLDSVQRLMQQQLALRQIDPQCPIVLDMEEIMRLTADDENAPGSALKSPEKMQAEAQQRAEMEQAMQQAQQMESVAGAAKDGGAAVKSLSQAGQPANDTGGSAAA